MIWHAHNHLQKVPLQVNVQEFLYTAIYMPSTNDTNCRQFLKSKRKKERISFNPKPETQLFFLALCSLDVVRVVFMPGPGALALISILPSIL